MTANSRSWPERRTVEVERSGRTPWSRSFQPVRRPCHLWRKMKQKQAPCSGRSARRVGERTPQWQMIIDGMNRARFRLRLWLSESLEVYPGRDRAAQRQYTRTKNEAEDGPKGKALPPTTSTGVPSHGPLSPSV